MAVVNRSHSYLINVPILGHPGIRRLTPLTPTDLYGWRRRQQQRLSNMISEQNRKLMTTVRAVEQSNVQRLAFNRRVYAVLSESTKQPLNSSPHYWWDWWKDYNELGGDGEKARYDFHSDRFYNRPIFVGMASCFAPGTPVWTEIGEVPIETIRRGDRVLSQDTETGEISYRLVLGTTLRPPSETLVIKVAGDQIVATRGHPFWVVGLGWKMAKELKVGDRLHSVGGGMEVNEIEPGEIGAAHNLVVEGSRNYFVGKNRLLVHDNTIRESTDMPLPGWLALAN